MLLDLIYVVFIILNCFLACLALIFGKKNKGALFFSAAIFSISLWILSGLITANSTAQLFWYRMNLTTGAFIPFFIVLFLFYFPKQRIQLTPLKTIGISFLPILTIIFTQTSYMVQGVTSAGQPILDNGYLLYMLYFVSYLAIILYQMVSGLFRFQGEDRKQMLFFTSSFLIAVAFSTLTNIILPRFGIYTLLKLGRLFPSINIFATIYTILKHKLLNISVLISKTFSFVLSLSFLMTLYLISLWAQSSYLSEFYSILALPFTIVYWVSVSLIFQNLRLKLQSTTDKLFLRGSYNYKKLLIQLSNDLAKCSNLNELFTIITSTFIFDIEVSPVHMFIPENFEEKREISKTLILNELVDENIIATDIQLNPNSSLLRHIQSHPEVFKLSDTDMEISSDIKSLRSIISIPCIYKNQLFALLLVGQKLSEDPFNDDDLDLFSTIATQIPIVLDRIKQSRVSAEMDVARLIQTEILPKEPQIPGLEMTCFMKPADEVGGDYYDVFHINGYSWMILGDVTGHGVGSGMVMFMVQSILSSILYSKPNIEPSELNYHANIVLSQNLKRLSEQRPMALVTVKTKDGKDFTVSGNHDCLYIFRSKTKHVETKSVNHIPFGIGLVEDLEKDTFEQETFSLESGDILFLSTDGIVEAPLDGDYKKEQYNEPRLIKFLEKNSHLPINEIRDTLISELDKFTNGVYHDDVTFIVAKSL